MITLSALYAGAIPLSSAAAIAIGADLGTTVTALLGALAGSVDKKRVAAAIIIFNVVADAIAFLFLHPLLAFVTDVLHIADPLFALVAFHSLFNLIGIAIFLPLIGPLSRWLGRRFRSTRFSPLRHINLESGAVPEVAVENASRETARLIDQVAGFRDSANDRYNAYTNYFQESVREFYERVAGLAQADLEPLRFEALVNLKTTSEGLHESLHKRIYDEVTRGELSQIEISTLLNVNREMYVSNQSLISALADTLLGMDAADDFESIPVTR